jgi:hypothetical protein
MIGRFRCHGTFGVMLNHVESSDLACSPFLYILAAPGSDDFGICMLFQAHHMLHASPCRQISCPASSWSGKKGHEP